MQQAVIDRERRGDYLGKTVQVVPHITDCIQVRPYCQSPLAHARPQKLSSRTPAYSTSHMYSMSAAHAGK